MNAKAIFGPQIHVEKLVFSVGPGVRATKFDAWKHYRQGWAQRADKRGVDLLVLVPDASGVPRDHWFVEVKDFRVITTPPRPSNLTKLGATVAQKVLDTHACLQDAAAHASVPEEAQFSQDALAAPSTHVVLHIETYPGGEHSRLFPAPAVLAANVKGTLARELFAFGATLRVCLGGSDMRGYPWAVEDAQPASASG